MPTEVAVRKVRKWSKVKELDWERGCPGDRFKNLGLRSGVPARFYLADLALGNVSQFRECGLGESAEIPSVAYTLADHSPASSSLTRCCP